MRRALLLTLLLAPLVSPEAQAADRETRCGWYHNPTPANHWLEDGHSSWEVSLQGRGGAPGFDDLPPEAFDFGTEWVKVNGFYGYGCACIEGAFGAPEQGEVIRIDAIRPLPLARCEADPALPSVADWGPELFREE